ncbi:MAG: TetR/AcrR family transcriptional regulator [Solobacterium sp.]|jgi:probable dihydroxyacetone kinase regulator|nr:TetR/AcrR family transcriptional regulator [Solobacterium sp.]
MSDLTKKVLAQSLKQLASEKPIEKITISEIAKMSGVNRQTFYYHFSDIYDLIEWIYTTEAAKVLGSHHTYDTWQEGLTEILAYIQSDRAFVMSTYHSLSRENLERFLYSRTEVLVRDVVDELSRNKNVSEEDRAFIADFYKYAFTGLVLDWISKGMNESPKLLVERLDRVILGSMPQAVERFSKA